MGASTKVVWHQVGACFNATSPIWGFLSKFHKREKSQIIVFIDNVSVGAPLACHICVQLYTARREL
jgi:hypothetical protein